MNHYSPKDIFNSYAKQYQDKFMNFDLYHETFDAFCKLIKTKSASILEIGCGPGNISKYLLNKRPDFKLLGIDIAPNMINLAKKNNPSADFKLMDAKHISEIKTKFNAVMCGFTFPYLNKKEVLQLIKNVSELLEQNGIFYISTMEDKYYKSKFLPKGNDSKKGLFTYYHEADYLVEALHKEGFKIEIVERKNYPEPKDNSKDLIIIAKKINPTTI